MAYQLNPLVKEGISPMGIVAKGAKIANFVSNPGAAIGMALGKKVVNAASGGKLKPLTQNTMGKNPALKALSAK